MDGGLGECKSVIPHCRRIIFLININIITTTYMCVCTRDFTVVFIGAVAREVAEEFLQLVVLHEEGGHGDGCFSIFLSFTNFSHRHHNIALTCRERNNTFTSWSFLLMSYTRSTVYSNN